MLVGDDGERKEESNGAAPLQVPEHVTGISAIARLQSR